MSITKKNGKYYCRFQIDGERKHLLCSGATTKQEAEKIEASFKYKLQQQQNGVIPREKDKLLLTELYADYTNYTKLNNKNWQRNLYRLEIIKNEWKTKRYAEEIRTEDIEKLKLALIQRGCSTVTVNRFLEIVSKMFNLAIDNEKLIRNPIRKNVKFKDKHYQIRYASETERDLLYKNSEGVIHDIIFIALNTGLREDNILHLKGKNINLDFKIIELTENKGNKHLKIPMNKLVYNYFKNKELIKDEYVFLNPKTNEAFTGKVFRTEWEKVKTKSGITNLRFHDLRHTVGTRLAEQGIPVNVIQNLLGHTDVRTTMQYIHCANKQLVEAMELL